MLIFKPILSTLKKFTANYSIFYKSAKKIFKSRIVQDDFIKVFLVI